MRRSRSVTAPDSKSAALRQQQALHRGLSAFEEHESRLTAVAVGRVVLALQRDLVSQNESGQRRSAVRGWRFSRNRLDAGEADFATILQAEAAGIDHLGDAALALRREKHAAAAAGPATATMKPAEHHCGAPTQCFDGNFFAEQSMRDAGMSVSFR